MSFTSIITNISDDKKNIKGQDDLIGGSFPVFKLFKESFQCTDTTIVSTRDVSTDSIYGRDVYGTAVYDDSYDNGFVVVRVINGDNFFVDMIAAQTFVDGTTTTATVDVNAGTVTFS